MVSAPDPLHALLHDLRTLRTGVGLREPQRLLGCSETFREVTGTANGALDDAQRIERGMSRLLAACAELDEPARETVLVELNLHQGHRHHTLTARQGSLAAVRACDAKTIRRHGNRAMETLAYLLTMPGQDTRPHDSKPGQGRPVSHFERLLWPVTAQRVTVISGEISPTALSGPLHQRVFLLESQENLAIVEAVANVVTVNSVAVLTVTSSGSVQAEELLDTLVVIGGPRSNAITARLLSELRLPAELVVVGTGRDKEKYFRLPGERVLDAEVVDGQVRRDVATLVLGPNPFNSSERLLLVAGLHSYGNFGTVMSVSRRRHNPVIARNLDLLSLRRFPESAVVQIVLEVPVVDGRVLPAVVEQANIFVVEAPGTV